MRADVRREPKVGKRDLQRSCGIIGGRGACESAGEPGGDQPPGAVSDASPGGAAGVVVVAPAGQLPVDHVRRRLDGLDAVALGCRLRPARQDHDLIADVLAGEGTDAVDVPVTGVRIRQPAVLEVDGDVRRRAR